MSESADNVDVWELSPAQCRVADELARCRSQSEAAEHCRVPLRTVQRWWTDERFRDYVRDIQAGYAEGYNEEFAMLIADCLMIERQSVRGEVAADDPRSIRAHEILKATAYRIAVRQHVVDRRPLSPDPARERQRLLPPGGDAA